MSMKKFLLTAGGLLIASAALFGACSGGGGGAASQLTGPNVSRGVITGFGSVIVNGVHFDVANAAVSVEGAAADVSALKLGMEVTVKSDGQTASSINTTNELEGPISSVTGTNTLVVLGQTVRTDAQTVFENVAGTTSLPAGNICEVHGFKDSAGVIHATRVEVKEKPTASTEVEVKGVVSNLTSSTFRMNGLVVDFSTAALKDFPASGITDGQSVEVKGTYGQFEAASSTLVAATIEPESELKASEGEHAEIQGVVTDYVSQSDFKVNGMTIDASGLSVAGLANDVEVEVEGTANAAGVLVAVKVELEQENENENEGPDDNSGR